MLEPSEELRREIANLQSLRLRELRKKYAAMLTDVPACRSYGILRALVAYRLQERFHGVSLSPAARDWLRGAEGADGRSRPAENAQLVRDWNGTRHVVNIRPDGGYEYNGAVYRSLSAVAREITGTRWNGKLFFKVKG